MHYAAGRLSLGPADAGAAAREETGGENSGPCGPALGSAVHPVSASRSAAPLCLRADCPP